MHNDVAHKKSEDYGSDCTGNMFGDIVSDGFAGLIGDLGLPAAQTWENIAVFEPTHGSAPKYAGYPVPVNPIAMIESACMMLDYLKNRKSLPHQECYFSGYC
jgi:3-isopropylmalate dehydrogenase